LPEQTCLDHLHTVLLKLRLALMAGVGHSQELWRKTELLQVHDQNRAEAIHTLLLPQTPRNCSYAQTQPCTLASASARQGTAPHASWSELLPS
jgi:hypothetical protein